MEFAVNWIVFSAVAIAVGSSIETRKLSKIIRKQKFTPFFNYFYLIRILMALSLFLLRMGSYWKDEAWFWLNLRQCKSKAIIGSFMSLFLFSKNDDRTML